MISDEVASINAGFTKVAGQSPSSKVPKREEKVVNLDDLKKVQIAPKICEVERKIVKYNEHLIQCPEYDKEGKSVEPKKNYINIQI